MQKLTHNPHLFLITGIAFLIIFSFGNLYASTSRTFNYSLNDLTFDTLQGYDVVSMLGAVKIDSIGKPNLPYYTYSFIIPNNLNVTSVNVTSSQYEKLDGSYVIYPAQPEPRTITPGETFDFVEPDSATYNSTDPYPGFLTECVDMGFFDGANKIATIAVYPLQYVPANEDLILYTSISIDLQFSASSDQPVYPEMRTSWGIKYYEIGLKSLVINTEDIDQYDYEPNLQTVPYVQNPNISYYPYTIITTEAMSSYYDDFVEWQRMKGVYAGVVTVEDIYYVFPDGDEISGIDDDAGSIRQYLAYGWENCGLVFALLGGDENAVPFRKGFVNLDWTAHTEDEFAPADFYFTEFNSIWELEPDHDDWQIYEPTTIDYFPEIFVGRLTADSQARVDWWLNKVKKYETSPGDGDHLFRMCWSQSDQMQGGQQIQSDWLTNASWWPGFIDVTIFEEIPNWYCPSQNPYDPRTVTDPQGADVIDEMNASPYYGWLNLYGHGNYRDIVVASNGVNTQSGGWGIHTFDSYNNPWFQYETGNGLDDITNQDDKFPIFYTIACRSFSFHNEEEWITPTEGFTCFSSKGGPAALGNSEVGYVSSSYKLHSKFLKQLWVENNYVIGMANGLSKTQYQNLVLAMNMTLVGSPEMNVWITQPLEFTLISHPLSIPETGSDNFTVWTGVTTTGINGERPIVCIYQENGGFWQYSETDESGNVTFDIDLTSTDKLWITANRYDYILYQYSMIPGVPGPPQDVTLEADPDNHPLIQWDANPEPDIEGYNVFKQVSAGGSTTRWAKQNDQLITTTSWVDETFDINPTAGATAYYYVTAVDDEEDESDGSEIVSTQGHQMQSSEPVDMITALLQDYDGLLAAPNPFNETVQIKFAIPEEGRANVSIYNLSGRKVADLFDGMANARELSQLTFNAGYLGSGVYFCLLRTSEKVTVRKLVYLK